METEWFSLRVAQLHLRPYTWPRFEVTAASTVSPAGPRLAGRLGTSLLTIGASSTEGIDVLNRTWEIVETEAREAGKTVSREGWRLVNFFHIADTEARRARTWTTGCSGSSSIWAPRRATSWPC